jgi:hypothetical protein
MANRSTSNKMARGAFGFSLCAFLVPGLHYSMNLGSPPSQIATEAGLLGLACAALGLILAFASKAAMSRSGNETGAGLADAATVISILGGLGWTLALLMRAA